MADLIDRQAVIDLLKKSTSRDIEEVVVTEKNIKLIMNMPKAYDVENVVADLQALKTKYEKLQRVCEDKFEANELHIRCLQIDKDIEIVKAGGING